MTKKFNSKTKSWAYTHDGYTVHLTKEAEDLYKSNRTHYPDPLYKFMKTACIQKKRTDPTDLLKFVACVLNYLKENRQDFEPRVAVTHFIRNEKIQ